MATKGSQESLQSRLSFFHHGRLFSSDRDDSSDSDDYLETGLKETVVLRRWERSKQKFGFIKRVDKGRITTVKDLES